MISHNARNVFTRLTLSAVFLTGASTTVLAQDATDEAVTQYSQTLDQIGNLKLMIAQKEAFLKSQEAQIKSLEVQIAQSASTNEAVGPMFDKMAEAIENEMTKDIPFRPGERFSRLDSVRTTIADETALPADKMRKLYNIYNIEVGYGNTLASYPGDNPLTPGRRLEACRADAANAKCALSDKQTERLEAGLTIDDMKDELLDGDYLHYGRLALVYMEKDESEAYRYVPETKEWEAFGQGKLLEIRRSIRIAKGEAAPGVVTAPVMFESATN